VRFLLEVVEAAVRELGPGRVGVRLSPFGKFNGIPADPRTEETLLYVAEQLARLGVAYLHLVYELGLRKTWTLPSSNRTTSTAPCWPRFGQRFLAQSSGAADSLIVKALRLRSIPG
jgi:2,4-dienoyl-CoA reductase-like NADH-dependent reductase (Old Yellow Enzyme family)